MPGYSKATHEPIDDTALNIELITNAAAGNATMPTNLLSTTTTSIGIPSVPGDLHLNADEKYDYLISVLKSLSGFSYGIVKLNDKLIIDIDNAKLIQRPIVSAPASVAGGAGAGGAGTGGAGTEGAGTEGAGDGEPTEGETAGLVVAGAALAFMGATFLSSGETA